MQTGHSGEFEEHRGRRGTLIFGGWMEPLISGKNK